jgi:FKBP-type peptidyl-prolyl cis-trans isomerase FklB
MMKFTSIAIVLALLISWNASAQLKDRADKISYSIGVNLGKNVLRQGVALNTDIFIQGLKDALAEKKLLMTDQEIQDTLMSFQKETSAKLAEKAKKTADENLKKGQAFLEANKKKDSVITLPDGLQYKILQAGAGRVPTLEDSVTVNYRGYMIDGTEFDNSYKRGAPATFTLSNVIKGWQEAIQLMKTGSKWELFIPSELAYGEKGYGSIIPPNSVLVFEVDLVGFK